jgi:hypothetical protein
MSETREKYKSRLQHLFANFSTRFFIGITVIVFSFGYYFYDLHLSYKYGKENNSDMKLALIGLNTLILSWFFGSSKSESDKSKTEQVKSLENATNEI